MPSVAPVVARHRDTIGRLATMPYTTLLLDFDHTLFDSEASEAAAFTRALASVGVEEPSKHRATYKAINGALWAQLERGEIAPEVVKVRRFERLLETLDIMADAEALAHEFTEGLSRHGDLYAGARDVLGTLSGHANLALITNGLADVQRARLERLGLDGCFDTVVISSEVGATKPGRAIFDVTFEALGNPAKDTAMILGDSLTSDIRGGLDYGISTCWYNPSGKSRPSEGRPRYEIRRLEEAVPLVANGTAHLEQR